MSNSRNQREGRFAGRANRQTRQQFGQSTGYTRVQPGVVMDYLRHGWVGPGDTCAWWVLVLRDTRHTMAHSSDEHAVAVSLASKLTGIPETFIRAKLGNA